jgi:CRP/FNR family transcriptional regulator, cyclic AMP receptor protein
MADNYNVLTLLKSKLREQLGGSSIDIFNKLDVRDWGSFFRAGVRLDFEHNAVILREGQPGDAVYFLAEGQVRVEQMVNDVNIELARLPSGCIFGEMSFLDGANVSASVAADGHVELVKVPNKDLQNLIEEDTRFAAHFYQSLAATLSGRLRATNKIINQV